MKLKLVIFLILCSLCSLCFADYERDDLKPWTDNTFDLGTSSLQWKDLYLGGTLDLGTNTITDGTMVGDWSIDGSLTLTAGKTISTFGTITTIVGSGNCIVGINGAGPGLTGIGFPGVAGQTTTGNAGQFVTVSDGTGTGVYAESSMGAPGRFVQDGVGLIANNTAATITILRTGDLNGFQYTEPLILGQDDEPNSTGDAMRLVKAGSTIFRIEANGEVTAKAITADGLTIGDTVFGDGTITDPIGIDMTSTALTNVNIDSGTITGTDATFGTGDFLVVGGATFVTFEGTASLRMDNQTKIRFTSEDTYICADEDNPENLHISADNNIILEKSNVEITKSVADGDVSLTLKNTAPADVAPFESVSLIATTTTSDYPMGKIVFVRGNDYTVGATRSSILEFYTALEGTDTLALSIDKDGDVDITGTLDSGAITTTGLTIGNMVLGDGTIVDDGGGGSIAFGGTDLTGIGTATAEQFTSTDDITMQGHLLTLGDGSATNIVTNYSADVSGVMTYNPGNPSFDFSKRVTATSALGRASQFVGVAGTGCYASSQDGSGMVAVQNSTLTGNNGNPTLQAFRNGTLDGHQYTGPILAVDDNVAASTGPLFRVTKSGIGTVFQILSTGAIDTIGDITAGDLDIDAGTGDYTSSGLIKIRTAAQTASFPASIEVLSDSGNTHPAALQAGIASEIVPDVSDHTGELMVSIVSKNSMTGTLSNNDIINTVGFFGGSNSTVTANLGDNEGGTLNIFGLQYTADSEGTLAESGRGTLNHGVFAIDAIATLGKNSTLSGDIAATLYGERLKAVMDGTYNSAIEALVYGIYAETDDQLDDGTGDLTSYGVYINAASDNADIGSGGTLTSWALYNANAVNNYMGPDNAISMWGTTNTDGRIFSDGSNLVIDVGTALWLGDGGANHTEVEPDGTIEFVGDATVWADYVTPLTRALFGGSANDPTLTKIADDGAGSAGVWGFVFSDGDEVLATVQMPHGWLQGSTIYPHIHFQTMTDVDPSDNFDIDFEYWWADIDEDFPANTTMVTTTHATGIDSQYLHQTGELTPAGIDGTGHTISSVLMIRIGREASAGDNYGDGVVIMDFDIHHELDMVGSRGITTK